MRLGVELPKHWLEGRRIEQIIHLVNGEAEQLLYYRCESLHAFDGDAMLRINRLDTDGAESGHLRFLEVGCRQSTGEVECGINSRGLGESVDFGVGVRALCVSEGQWLSLVDG